MTAAQNILAIGGTGAWWPFANFESLAGFLEFREGLAKGSQERRVLFIVAPPGLAEVGTSIARSLTDAASPWSRIFSRLISGDLDGVVALALEEIPMAGGRLNIVNDWLVEKSGTRELARLLEPMAEDLRRPSWVVVVALAGLVTEPEKISGAVVVILAELPAEVFEEPAEDFAP